MNLTFKLNTGHSIPLIGFGTYQIRGNHLINETLDYALKAGYRHIDTALVYRNEEHIGKALQTLLPKYNLKREDIFITSKLISQYNKDERFIEELVLKSLDNLQTEYIDLFLIHWPGVNGLQVSHPDNVPYRKKAWKVLCKLHHEGKCRSIGVSNYTVKHIRELLEDCNGVRPAVNQVEWHPHYFQLELLELCKTEGIFLQAYSSLGTSLSTDLRDDPVVGEVAVRLCRSPAQILLRWAIERNVGIIPKARSRDHIEENIALDFEIPPQDMELLDGLRVTSGAKYAWDPDTVV
ncbi:glyoxal reductase-like [Malaya genurostris]|uniref:glyoxal reductase-like n=1 Tax=Malaya genurostris TaxID=325434 RepID=UPI0026F3C14F|nr:glyoxal reductase-like [Malaya genurostris]XP_058450040.1 glyoxal reductase-like [Malaya genurostris]